MGTITSGIGLMSGLDIQGLVTALMAIEARPLALLTQRVTEAREQQAGLMELNARVTAIQLAIDQLARPSNFLVRTARSSNENVLMASASESTPINNFSFIVRSLVSSHQMASRGFADSDQTPVGEGTLTFEVGHGNVAPHTSLSELNGFAGVDRGIIHITDRTGAEADVDLRTATTMQDVLDAINRASGVSVRAEVDDDHLVVTDISGGTTHVLQITDPGSDTTAADLGIRQSDLDSDGVIVGNQIVSLSERTQLSYLNDGIGVGYNANADDFQILLQSGPAVRVNLSPDLRGAMQLAELNDGAGVELGTIRITNREGQTEEIDLSSAVTLQDVMDAINANSIDVSVAISGSSLQLADESDGTLSNFIIEDVTGSAAEDLGITADVAADSVTGVGIHRMNTLGDVIRAIENAEGNEAGELLARISDDGHSLVLVDTTGGLPQEITEIQSLNGSTAARDLGLIDGFTGDTLTSSRLTSGMNTVLLSSLNGGSGVRVSDMSFTLRDGETNVSVVLSDAETLSDVIRAINQAGDGALRAEIDNGGTGIRITDLTEGPGSLSVTGELAEDLHLTGAADGEQLVSGDLQMRYISESTLLSDLNNGNGVSYGDFTITLSNGIRTDISIDEDIDRTVGDVIRKINNLNIDVTAQINANGDGIELVDSAGGASPMTVVEKGGSTAGDLGIEGTADPDTNVLTGSFAVTIEIDRNDTLDDVARKINDAGVGIRASVLNDQYGAEPYHLMLSSAISGSTGQIMYSAMDTDLGFETMSAARDAVVLVGDLNDTRSSPMVITSDTNTITGISPGLTINLLSVSDQPVEVTIDQDTESITANIQGFVDAFNETMDRIGELMAVNPESGERGLLQGNRYAQQLQSELLRLVTSTAPDSSLEYRRLSDLGIMVDSRGGMGIQLTMSRTVGDGTHSYTVDGAERLQQALETNLDAVKDFFTRLNVIQNDDGEDELENIGFAARAKELIMRLTDSVDGTLTRADEAIESRVELFERRAEHLQDLLDMKEARLYAQFQAMEQALAGLQSQQGVLSQLAGLASAMYSSGGG